MKKSLPIVLLTLVPLFVLGTVLAQDTSPSIPTADQAIINVVIGILSGMLVKPLTAIAKKLGRTQGVTTVAISIALSLLVGFGYTYAQAQAQHGDWSFWQLFSVALVAFLKANGDYISQVIASVKANKVSEGQP